MQVRLKEGIRSLTMETVDGLRLVHTKETVVINAATFPRVSKFCDAVSGKWRVLDRRGKRLRVWVPDGIGDIHWVFLKLGGIVKVCGAQGVDLVVRDLEPFRPRRVKEFVKMNPVVKTVVFSKVLIQPFEPGFLVEEQGFDYVLDATPVLTAGKRIEDWIPEIPVDFDYMDYKPPGLISQKRVVIYFGGKDAQYNWGGAWGASDWAYLVRILSKRWQVFAVGMDCDREFADEVKAVGCEYVDMIGKTSFDEVFGMLTESALVIGSVSGLVMLSAHLKRPTIVLWPGNGARLKLPEKMRTSWLQSNKTYKPLSYDMPREDIARVCLRELY